MTCRTTPETHILLDWICLGCFFSSTVSLSKQEIISLCVANVRVYNRCVKSVHVKWPYFLAIYLHVFLRAVMELQWQVYCGFIKLLNYRSDFHTAGRDTLAELLGFARAEPGQFNSWSDEQSESRCWCSTEDFFWGFFFFFASNEKHFVIVCTLID